MHSFLLFSTRALINLEPIEMIFAQSG
jgi:hypothetical protein